MKAKGTLLKYRTVYKHMQEFLDIQMCIRDRRTIDKPSPKPSLPCAPGRRVNSWKIRSLSAGSIPLPVGYFCGFVLGWGLVGVWMAFPFGLTSAGVMLWLRFRYKTRTR